MRKHFLLLLLTVVLLLSACDTGIAMLPTEQTPPTIQTEPEQIVETFPVEEDVFYFSNELEYDRLYSQRTNGSDLKLVLDEYCYQVQQVGDTVYFIDGADLCSYHISTATRSIYIENVIDYKIDGDDLVYFRFTEEHMYYNEMYHRNLRTGEERLVDTFVMSSYDLHDGYLYYSGHSPQTGDFSFSVYDIENNQIIPIMDHCISCYGITGTDGGVIFESMDMNYDNAWYFATCDGRSVEKLDYSLTYSCTVFHVDDDFCLCTARYYDEVGQEEIHRHNSDGTVTQLYEANPNAYLFVSEIRDGLWLIDQSFYQGWGPLDEYGYAESLAMQTEYLLLHENGTVTPITAPGVLGSMFAQGDFPVIDSSTARKPVTEALYNLFVKNYKHEGTEPLCSTTHGAWMNMADKKADIALLAAPTEEELAYLRERGVEIEMKLYGGDGLVFIGNAANPVTNLTHEQILAIYRGEITNWKEVGGPDHPITVYYRDDQSGSQRLFEKLVFKGEEIPNFEKLHFSIMDDMSSIVNIILEDPYSIGYSIMTYLDEVYAEDNLQVFSVNGVSPSPETVADASYRYHTQGYVVIRSDEPADSPARRLFNWFGTSVCNELLTRCSVTPLQDGVG